MSSLSCCRVIGTVVVLTLTLGTSAQVEDGSRKSGILYKYKTDLLNMNSLEDLQTSCSNDNGGWLASITGATANTNAKAVLTAGGDPLGNGLKVIFGLGRDSSSGSPASSTGGGFPSGGGDPGGPGHDPGDPGHDNPGGDPGGNDPGGSQSDWSWIYAPTAVKTTVGTVLEADPSFGGVQCRQGVYCRAGPAALINFETRLVGVLQGVGANWNALGTFAAAKTQSGGYLCEYWSTPGSGGGDDQPRYKTGKRFERVAITTQMTMTECEASCKQRGGWLASIPSQTVLDVVKAMLDDNGITFGVNGQMLIGLSKQAGDFGWRFGPTAGQVFLTGTPSPPTTSSCAEAPNTWCPPPWVSSLSSSSLDAGDYVTIASSSTMKWNAFSWDFGTPGSLVTIPGASGATRSFLCEFYTTESRTETVSQVPEFVPHVRRVAGRKYKYFSKSIGLSPERSPAECNAFCGAASETNPNGGGWLASITSSKQAAVARQVLEEAGVSLGGFEGGGGVVIGLVPRPSSGWVWGYGPAEGEQVLAEATGQCLNEYCPTDGITPTFQDTFTMITTLKLSSDPSPFSNIMTWGFGQEEFGEMTNTIGFLCEYMDTLSMSSTLIPASDDGSKSSKFSGSGSSSSSSSASSVRSSDASKLSSHGSSVAQSSRSGSGGSSSSSSSSSNPVVASSTATSGSSTSRSSSSFSTIGSSSTSSSSSSSKDNTPPPASSSYQSAASSSSGWYFVPSLNSDRQTASSLYASSLNPASSGQRSASDRASSGSDSRGVYPIPSSVESSFTSARNSLGVSASSTSPYSTGLLSGSSTTPLASSGYSSTGLGPSESSSKSGESRLPVIVSSAVESSGSLSSPVPNPPVSDSSAGSSQQESDGSSAHQTTIPSPPESTPLPRTNTMHHISRTKPYETQTRTKSHSQSLSESLALIWLTFFYNDHFSTSSPRIRVSEFATSTSLPSSHFMVLLHGGEYFSGSAIKQSSGALTSSSGQGDQGTKQQRGFDIQRLPTGVAEQQQEEEVPLNQDITHCLNFTTVEKTSPPLVYNYLLTHLSATLFNRTALWVELAAVSASDKMDLTMKLLDLKTPVTVFLMVEGSCMNSRRDFPPINFTILPALPKEKTGVVLALQSAEEVADVFRAVPGVAITASRSSLIASLAECEPAIGQKLSGVTNPAGLSFGPVEVGEYVSASIFNHIIILGCAFAHVLSCVLYMHIYDCDFKVASSRMRCPSLTIIPVFVFLEPTCMAAAVVMIHGDGFGWKLVGVLSELGCFTYVFGLAIYLRRTWAAKFIKGKDPSRIRRDARKKRNDVRQARREEKKRNAALTSAHNFPDDNGESSPTLATTSDPSSIFISDEHHDEFSTETESMIDEWEYYDDIPFYDESEEGSRGAPTPGSAASQNDRFGIEHPLLADEGGAGRDNDDDDGGVEMLPIPTSRSLSSRKSSSYDDVASGSGRSTPQKIRSRDGSIRKIRGRKTSGLRVLAEPNLGEGGRMHSSGGTPLSGVSATSDHAVIPLSNTNDDASSDLVPHQDTGSAGAVGLHTNEVSGPEESASNFPGGFNRSFGRSRSMPKKQKKHGMLSALFGRYKVTVLIIGYFIDGNTKWKDMDPVNNKGYARRNRLLFMDYRGKYYNFLAVELFVMSLCGLLEGVKLGVDRCEVLAGFLFFLLLFFWIGLIATRPYNAPFLLYFSVLLTTVQVISAFLVFLSLASKSEVFSEVAEFFTLITFYAVIGRAVFDILPKLKQAVEAVAKSIYAGWRKAAEKVKEVAALVPDIIAAQLREEEDLKQRKEQRAREEERRRKDKRRKSRNSDDERSDGFDGGDDRGGGDLAKVEGKAIDGTSSSSTGGASSHQSHLTDRLLHDKDMLSALVETTHSTAHLSGGALLAPSLLERAILGGAATTDSSPMMRQASSISTFGSPSPPRRKDRSKKKTRHVIKGEEEESDPEGEEDDEPAVAPDQLPGSGDVELDLLLDNPKKLDPGWKRAKSMKLKLPTQPTSGDTHLDSLLDDHEDVRVDVLELKNAPREAAIGGGTNKEVSESSGAGGESSSLEQQQATPSAMVVLKLKGRTHSMPMNHLEKMMEGMDELTELNQAAEMNNIPEIDITPSPSPIQAIDDHSAPSVSSKYLPPEAMTAPVISVMSATEGEEDRLPPARQSSMMLSPKMLAPPKTSRIRGKKK